MNRAASKLARHLRDGTLWPAARHRIGDKLNKWSAIWKTCGSPYYRVRPHLWSAEIASMDRRIAVSPERGFTYVRIPKAANSTVMNTLYRCFPLPHPVADENDVECIKNSFPSPRQLQKSQIRQLLEHHFIFTLVRNPYHRTLSAYLMRFHPKPENEESGFQPESAKEKYMSRYELEQMDFLNRFGDAIARHGGGAISFNAFCRWLASGGEARDVHWMLQCRLINLVGLRRMDYIGRVESLDRDLPAIVNRVRGTEARVDIQDAGPEPTRATARCGEFYDEESVALVKQVYKRDFEALGYSQDPDW